MDENIKANKLIRGMRKDVLAKNILALKNLVTEQDFPVAEAHEKLQEVHTIFISIADAHSGLVVLIEDKEELAVEEKWMRKCLEDFMPEIDELNAVVNEKRKRWTTTENIKAIKIIRIMRNGILAKNVQALIKLVAQQDYPVAEAHKNLQEVHKIFTSIKDAHSDLVALIEDEEESRVEEKWMSQCVEKFMPKINELQAIVSEKDMATGITIKMELTINDASRPTLLFIQRMIEKSGDNEDVNRWLETVNTVETTGCKLPVKLIECSAEGIWKIKFETIKTVVPALPVLSKLLHVHNEHGGDETLRYLNSLKHNQIDIKEIEKAITKWLNARRKLIYQLQGIAVEIRQHKRITHIGKIASASTSATGRVVSSTVGILGKVHVTAPFALLVAGVSAVAVGNAAHKATSKAAVTFQDQKIQEANALIKQDTVTFKNLKIVQERYTNSLKSHMKIAKQITKVVLEFIKNLDDTISMAIKIGESIAKIITNVKAINTEIKSIDGKKVSVLKIITHGGKIVTEIVNTIRFAAHIITLSSVHSIHVVRTFDRASTVLGIANDAIAIANDIHTIVSSAIELSKNCPDKAADEIEEIAKDLANIEAPTKEELIIESLLAAADEIQIPYEGDVNNQ